MAASEISVNVKTKNAKNMITSQFSSFPKMHNSQIIETPKSLQTLTSPLRSCINLIQHFCPFVAFI